MNIRLRWPRGFTFIEMVVALAVLAAIVALLAPSFLSTVDSSRDDTASRELASVYTAIVGNPRTTFGYVGDVGDYPATLVDLVVSPGLPGWNGPYLNNARFENGTLIDAFGQPYEYYLLTGAAGSDQLAIVSRGADGLSTWTADPNAGTNDPNTAADFLGIVPSASGYGAGANNADNIVYPTPSPTNPNALDITTTGILALNIQNFDSNLLVNTFVAACPNLFLVTVTSQTRGTSEATDLGYAAGFELDLPQGIYDVLITAQTLTAAPFNEKLTVIPGQTIARSPNIAGLDSSGTDPFILTVTNKQPTENIEVFEFATKLNVQPPDSGSTVPANNGVRSFSVRACAQVFFKKEDSSTIRDQLIMPFGATTTTVGATAATLTFTNNTSQPEETTKKIRLFNNDMFFAQVKRGKTKTFTIGLLSDDVITAYDKNVTTLLKTQTLVAGANTMVVP